MYVWDFAALKPYWGLIWQGLLVTVFYTVTTVVAGLVIGLIVSVAGAMVVASLLCGVNMLQFASSIPRFITIHRRRGGSRNSPRTS